MIFTLPTRVILLFLGIILFNNVKGEKDISCGGEGSFCVLCIVMIKDLPLEENPFYQCATTRVHVRLPPSIDTANSTYSRWTLPPDGWLFGTWSQTYTSQPIYLGYLNFQFESSPFFPQSGDSLGKLNDLSTFQLAGSPTIYSIFGSDTPVRSNQRTLGPEWDYAFEFAASLGSNNTNYMWSMIGWGYDTCGVGYFVVYEDSSPTLDILSRSDDGPSESTLEEIFSAIRELGNGELAQLVNQTVAMVQNGARRGSPPFQCGVDCVNNTFTCEAIVGLC